MTEQLTAENLGGIWMNLKKQAGGFIVKSITRWKKRMVISLYWLEESSTMQTLHFKLLLVMINKLQNFEFNCE